MPAVLSWEVLSTGFCMSAVAALFMMRLVAAGEAVDSMSSHAAKV
jgi:hypothetical protein